VPGGEWSGEGAHAYAYEKPQMTYSRSTLGGSPLESRLRGPPSMGERWGRAMESEANFGFNSAEKSG